MAAEAMRALRHAPPTPHPVAVVHLDNGMCEPSLPSLPDHDDELIYKQISRLKALRLLGVEEKYMVPAAREETDDDLWDMMDTAEVRNLARCGYVEPTHPICSPWGHGDMTLRQTGARVTQAALKHLDSGGTLFDAGLWAHVTGCGPSREVPSLKHRPWVLSELAARGNMHLTRLHWDVKGLYPPSPREISLHAVPPEFAVCDMFSPLAETREARDLGLFVETVFPFWPRISVEDLSALQPHVPWILDRVPECQAAVTTVLTTTAAHSERDVQFRNLFECHVTLWGSLRGDLPWSRVREWTPEYEFRLGEQDSAQRHVERRRFAHRYAGDHYPVDREPMEPLTPAHEAVAGLVRKLDKMFPRPPPRECTSAEADGSTDVRFLLTGKVHIKPSWRIPRREVHKINPADALYWYRAARARAKGATFTVPNRHKLPQMLPSATELVRAGRTHDPAALPPIVFTDREAFQACAARGCPDGEQLVLWMDNDRFVMEGARVARPVARQVPAAQEGGECPLLTLTSELMARLQSTSPEELFVHGKAYPGGTAMPLNNILPSAEQLRTVVPDDIPIILLSVAETDIDNSLMHMRRPHCYDLARAGKVGLFMFALGAQGVRVQLRGCTAQRSAVYYGGLRPADPLFREPELTAKIARVRLFEALDAGPLPRFPDSLFIPKRAGRFGPSDLARVLDLYSRQADSKVQRINIASKRATFDMAARYAKNTHPKHASVHFARKYGSIVAHVEVLSHQYRVWWVLGVADVHCNCLFTLHGTPELFPDRPIFEGFRETAYASRGELTQLMVLPISVRNPLTGYFQTELPPGVRACGDFRFCRAPRCVSLDDQLQFEPLDDIKEPAPSSPDWGMVHTLPPAITGSIAETMEQLAARVAEDPLAHALALNKELSSVPNLIFDNDDTFYPELVRIALKLHVQYFRGEPRVEIISHGELRRAHEGRVEHLRRALAKGFACFCICRVHLGAWLVQVHGNMVEGLPYARKPTDFYQKLLTPVLPLRMELLGGDLSPVHNAGRWVKLRPDHVGWPSMSSPRALAQSLINEVNAGIRDGLWPQFRSFGLQVLPPALENFVLPCFEHYREASRECRRLGFITMQIQFTEPYPAERDQRFLWVRWVWEMRIVNSMHNAAATTTCTFALQDYQQHFLPGNRLRMTPNSQKCWERLWS